MKLRQFQKFNIFMILIFNIILISFVFIQLKYKNILIEITLIESLFLILFNTLFFIINIIILKKMRIISFFILIVNSTIIIYFLNINSLGNDYGYSWTNGLFIGLILTSIFMFLILFISVLIKKINRNFKIFDENSKKFLWNEAFVISQIFLYSFSLIVMNTTAEIKNSYIILFLLLIISITAIYQILYVLYKLPETITIYKNKFN